MMKLAPTAIAAALTATAVACAPAGSGQPNGTYLVPSQMAYGTYQAVPNNSIGGYVEVCANLACQVGAGMIENYIIDGTTYIVVPSNAVAVTIKRAQLTLVGGSPSSVVAR
jgi:hypothetical protein